MPSWSFPESHTPHRRSLAVSIDPFQPTPQPTDPRFTGIERLYGPAALARFRAATVAVVGIGGVGSWVAEALARSAIGHIVLMDLDDLCISNTNRQIHALSNTIGHSKVQTMAARILAINPSCQLTCLEAFFTQSTASQLFDSRPDVLIDAIDSVRQKALLLATARAGDVPVIAVGGMGGRIDPAQIQSADLARSHGDPLLAQVRKTLRTQHGFPRDPKRKFHIPCVFSPESPRPPQSDPANACATTPRALNCDTGFGAATHITATAAFHATALALQALC